MTLALLSGGLNLLTFHSWENNVPVVHQPDTLMFSHRASHFLSRQHITSDYPVFGLTNDFQVLFIILYKGEGYLNPWNHSATLSLFPSSLCFPLNFGNDTIHLEIVAAPILILAMIKCFLKMDGWTLEICIHKNTCCHEHYIIPPVRSNWQFRADLIPVIISFYKSPLPQDFAAVITLMGNLISA